LRRGRKMDGREGGKEKGSGKKSNMKGRWRMKDNRNKMIWK